MVSLNKRYGNGEITVLWQPSKCCHAGRCVRTLPEVFDVKRSPWVDLTAAPTEKIVAVIDTCPSGVLSYTYDDKE